MRWTVLLLLLTLAFAGHASETEITYQGQLNHDGMPYNGTPDMEFRLWSAVTSGYTFPNSNVLSQMPVQDGLFRVVLDFGEQSFGEQPLYLEVSVDGTPLAPRQLLTAAPHALTAAPWKRTLGGVGYADGPIGIGTAAPGAALHVRGSAITGSSANSAEGLNSFVSGGSVLDPNSASGHTAFVAGGLDNHAAGAFSFAGGYLARSLHQSTFVWSDSNAVEFASTGSNQFLVRASGGVGVNTNAPARDLHIRQDGTNSSSAGLELESAAGNAWGMYVAISDNLGFRYNDTLVARINAADGQLVSLSDRRFKQDIEPLAAVLDRVLQLAPSAYAMKGAGPDGPRTFGLIAQDVQRLFPEAVSRQEGVYGVSYGRISVLNTAALIELERRYRGIQAASDARLARLEADNAALRSRLAEAGRRLDDAVRRIEARMAPFERNGVAAVDRSSGR